MKFLYPLCLLLFVFASTPGKAVEFDSMYQKAYENCQEINPRDYETGLFFNPEGYRTYYKRSACLQRVAVEFRDLKLCSEVKRRLSLFSSGWGYSQSNCRELVDTQLQEDISELETLKQNYLAGPVSLTSVTMEKNGNGRDYDFIPRFADGFPHGYQLEFMVIGENGNRYPILSHGSYLKGSEDNLRLFLENQVLRTRFPNLRQAVTYDLEIRMSLSIGPGGPGGWLRYDILEEVFPADERTALFTTRVSF